MADENKDKRKETKQEKPGRPKRKSFRYHYSKGHKTVYVTLVILIIVLAGAFFAYTALPRTGSNANNDTNLSVTQNQNQNQNQTPGSNESTEIPEGTTPPMPPSGGLTGETITPPEPPPEASVNQTNETNQTTEPPIQQPPPSSGHGLTAQYFTTVTATGDPIVTKVVPNIDFIWSSDNQPAAGVPYSRFSAKFTGKIIIEKDGDYTFILTSDDGARMYIDGTQRGQNIWDNVGVSKSSALVKLTAGSHDIRIDYRNIVSTAKLQLEYWASSLNITRQIIPSDFFLTA